MEKHSPYFKFILDVTLCFDSLNIDAVHSLKQLRSSMNVETRRKVVYVTFTFLQAVTNLVIQWKNERLK